MIVVILAGATDCLKPCQSRISEMATRSNEWAVLVENWDELTTLYAEDGKCYER